MKVRAFTLLGLFLSLGMGTLQADPVVNFKGRKYILNSFDYKKTQNVFERSRKLLMNRLTDRINTEIPKEVNLLSVQSKVKNQNNRGSCAYFAATGMLESLIKIKQNMEVNLSEEFLIKYAKGVLGQSSYSDGSDEWSNLNAYKNGFLLEKDLPYSPTWFEKGLPCAQYTSDKPETPKTCYSHGRPTEAMLNSRISIPENALEVSRLENIDNLGSYYNDVAAILYLAKYKLPLMIALPVNTNGIDGTTGRWDYNEELANECKTNPDVCGGHAVVLTGYNLDKKVFYFKNSWGSDWAQNGYGEIPFSVVRNYAWQLTAGKLLKDIILPFDYNEYVIPTMDINVFNQEAEEVGGQKFISLKLDAIINTDKEFVITITQRLAYIPIVPNPDMSLVAQEDEAQVLPEYRNIYQYSPYDLQNYITTIRGKDGKLQLIAPVEDAKFSLPTYVINREGHDEQTLTARLSIYYHDDNGYNILKREYTPIP